MSSLDEDLRKKFGKLSRPLRDERITKGSYWDMEKGQKKYDWYKQLKSVGGFIVETPQANPDVVSSDGSPYNQSSDKGVHNQFDDLIERMRFLSLREKEIIQLLWEGKTEKEIAVILGVKRGTIATHLDRARKKIRGVSTK